MLIATICFLLDSILIFLGVKGIGKILTLYPSFFIYITWFGIAFLLFYGLLSMKNIFEKQHLNLDMKTDKISVKKTLSITLAISLLNPHVYLDTMLLIGSIGGRFEGFEQSLFIFGAISASFIWFFSLAYGSRILIPLFKKNITWKILDTLTSFIMFYIAYKLFVQL